MKIFTKCLRSFMVFTLLITLSMLIGCGKGDKLSFESVESGRMQANENAEFNAKAYRQNNPAMQASSIIVRGDSTQSASCGQGDGWATLDFVSPNGSVTKVKCSTVSAAIGCTTDEDFKKRPYASQDGVCSGEIPFPLPKIQK